MVLHWEGPSKHTYKQTQLNKDPLWVVELRRLSRGDGVDSESIDVDRNSETEAGSKEKP